MNEHALAGIFRRLLAGHHSLGGMELRVDATVSLSDAEFDLIWDELDAIDPDPLFRARSSTTTTLTEGQ